MRITNSTAAMRRNSAADSEGLKLYKKGRNARSGDQSKKISSGFSNSFQALVPEKKTGPPRNVATGANRNLYNSHTSRSTGLSAYNKNSASYKAEKADIMQSANFMKITNQGRQGMSSFFTASINSPANSSQTATSLTSIMSEGIRQYGIMENGLSSNFNIISQSASIFRSTGSLNANSGSLFNFL